MKSPERLSPLVLAYIGDAVFELHVREKLVNNVQEPVQALHEQAVNLVQAKAQAGILRRLEPFLTDVERDIVRRGRNAKSGFVPRHADVQDYRYSTGFEALIGFLYLGGHKERLSEILELATAGITGVAGGEPPGPELK
ncbi:MAG: Mini-ribonuclease 3 [Syntrophothermus sp.]